MASILSTAKCTDLRQVATNYVHISVSCRSRFVLVTHSFPLRPTAIHSKHLRLPHYHSQRSITYSYYSNLSSRETSSIMSGAAQGSGATSKMGEDKKAGGEAQKEHQNQQPALLEEDDEFEDFPVEGVLIKLESKVGILLISI